MSDQNLMPNYGVRDLKFVKGEGCYLTSDTGQIYLDFGSGIAVNALGHCHEAVVSSLQDQASKVWHVSNLYQIEAQEKLAKMLTDLSFADLAFFCNSGAEAVECALKAARKFQSETGSPDKYRIISIEGAFHGRTLATLAAGNQAKHLNGFGPKVDGFDQVPFGDLSALKSAITNETAAIIVEPIQGEGGVRPLTKAYAQAMRDLCDEHGLVLIFDEVQTGIGRTGFMFAYETLGVEPDIIALAKGLGSGFPMGACLTRQEIGALMGPGSHGSTFGGNYLASAVGCAVVDIVSRPEFLQQVRENSAYLKAGLERMHNEFGDIIEEVRGEGFLIGLKLSVEPSLLVNACKAQNFLTVPAGGQVMRLLPPLIAEKSQIDEALEKLALALATLKQA